MMTMNFRRRFTGISRVSALFQWVYLIGLTFRKFHHIKAGDRGLKIPLAAHTSFLLLCILFIARDRQDPHRTKPAHLHLVSSLPLTR